MASSYFSKNHTYYPPDTLKTVFLNDKSLSNPLKYSAKDSIIADLKSKKVYLYGKAIVLYEDMDLKANYIVIDLNKNEVLATYSFDSLKNKLGKPIFKQGNDEFEASRILYNFKTKKGLINEVKTQQGEGYLAMNVSKRQSNSEIHLKNGKFTTCDLDEPHFHFNLTKAVIVPNKRIVTGPVNLWIAGVPTPLALPFGYFPNTPKKSHGIIFPQLVPFSPNGFGIEKLGYYIPLGNRWETTFFGSVFSRGSWGLSNSTRYNIRYKATGNFNLDFQQLRNNFPNKNVNNRFLFNWNHTQDTKFHPTWRFGASVNFISDNNSKNSLEPNNQQFFNNEFRSNVFVNKVFKGTPFSLSIKAGISQNTISKVFNFEAPSISFNVSRYYLPFGKLKKVQGGRKKWYEKIGIIYNLDFLNRGRVNDSLFTQENKHLIGRRFLNGIRQRLNLASTIKIFKGTVNWTPFNLNYTGRLNFQSIRKEWDSVNQIQIVDTLGAGYSHDLTYNMQLSTVVYGKYAFKGKKRVVLKHNMTPSIGFSISPDISSIKEGFVGANGILERYSPFERSLYREQVTRRSGSINYRLGNTFQIKYRKKNKEKDTIINLISDLSVNGSYDFFRDSMKLSRFSLYLRMNPAKFITITSNATFSPYGWNKNRAEVKEFAVKKNGKLGRITNFYVNAGFNFTSKDSYNKIIDASTYGPNWDSDFNYFYNHPQEIIDFSVPWKIGLNYNLTYNLAYNSKSNSYVDTVTQSVRFNGLVRITKRWRIRAEGVFNFQDKKVTQLNLSIQRDMHCWQLSFDWWPIGSNQSFMLRFNVKASMLRDLKYEIRRPPEFF